MEDTDTDSNLDTGDDEEYGVKVNDGSLRVQSQL